MKSSRWIVPAIAAVLTMPALAWAEEAQVNVQASEVRVEANADIDSAGQQTSLKGTLVDLHDYMTTHASADVDNRVQANPRATLRSGQSILALETDRGLVILSKSGAAHSARSERSGLRADLTDRAAASPAAGEQRTTTTTRTETEIGAEADTGVDAKATAEADRREQIPETNTVDPGARGGESDISTMAGADTDAEITEGGDVNADAQRTAELRTQTETDVDVERKSDLEIRDRSADRLDRSSRSIGQQVTVNGTLYEKGGIRYLVADSITPDAAALAE